MSTTTPTAESRPTASARVEVTDASLQEVRSFAARRDRDVYLERQGSRTYLVAVDG